MRAVRVGVTIGVLACTGPAFASMLNLACTEQWANKLDGTGDHEGSGAEVRFQIDTTNKTAREGGDRPVGASITSERIEFKMQNSETAYEDYIIDRVHGTYLHTVIEKNLNVRFTTSGPCQIDQHPGPKF